MATSGEVSFAGRLTRAFSELGHSVPVALTSSYRGDHHRPNSDGGC